ncbi:flagellar biosynthesis anti-sigma factor FlgM [Marispirochaeta sp.]|uniref:flagellar biosynthesis anti-sigma factor FlgM n=1 Tax=Marispirochaeta sp. TaxID=2038653 RepID=UPI0029C79DF0|nr:flagellar biosynthesis anti-sigma factor FlgM [Marispirochaeta sp.]
MTIEGLGPIDSISKLKKNSNTSKPEKVSEKDSVNVSSEAKNLAELYQANEVVKNSADVRMDRVAEVKRKLEDPNYINDNVIEMVAENIMKNFGL